MTMVLRTSGVDPLPITNLIPSESVTRRQFMFSAVGAAMFVTCGDLAEEEAEPPPQIQDYFGMVAVPACPERIVAGDELTLGNLLALGVEPVGGVYFTQSLAPHLQTLLPEGITNVAQSEEELDLEKVLALNADLLITVGAWQGDPYNQERCEQYKQALPTYCYEFGDVYEEQLKNNVLVLGQALGMEERADEVIERFDARVQELRELVTATGFDSKPVSVIRVRDLNDYSIRVGTTESILFRAIGIPQPAGQQNPEDFAINISAEQLNMLNNSYALVVYNLADGLTEAMIRKSEVWQSLTPVQEGRVVFVEPAVWYSNDILGAFAIMDDIEEKLLPLAAE